MTLADKIAEEARTLPEELAREALDFILFIERRYATERGLQAQAKPDWNVISIDTRGWRFDREEANAR